MHSFYANNACASAKLAHGVLLITVTACIDRCIVLQPAACILLVTSCYADLDSLKMGMFGVAGVEAGASQALSVQTLKKHSMHGLSAT